MRALLHAGLFTLALGTVAGAEAQDRRRSPRQTTVVVDARRAPRVDRWRHPHHRNNRAFYEMRRHVEAQRRDHQELVRITRRWREAKHYRDPRAKRHAERRADAWISREIAESKGLPGHGRYVVRLHALRRELNAYDRGRGRGYHAYDRGHGGGYYTQHRPYEGRVFRELVQLSEGQLLRTESRARRHMNLAFSYR